MTNQILLQQVIESLKRQNKMPRRIDFSKVGDRYWCVVADSEKDSDVIINQDVFTGHSFDKEVALLKALSERAERLSFIEGHHAGTDSCQTERSDGFAAMPGALDSVVRDNALNEALERFVWGTWWDNADVAFSIEKIDLKNKNSSYLTEIVSVLNIEDLILLKPIFEFQNKEVQIIFAKIKNGGYLSGGACGDKGTSENTFYRGMDELYRHGLAYKNALTKGQNPESFYEQRLFYFASGIGNQIVDERLRQSGNASIVIPKLRIDSDVPTSFSDYKVHRCLFENQPPFVSGALERLCL